MNHLDWLVEGNMFKSEKPSDLAVVQPGLNPILQMKTAFCCEP